MDTPSSSPSDQPNPSPLLLPAPPSSSSASRRLPPPCWSHDETVALIDSYRDKWYSLRRGNLRASHWQEVADDIGVKVPVNPPKTAVQCRHKMEKLRKRYRSEIQRAAPFQLSRHPHQHRFISSWVHFNRMHSMELGPTPSKPLAQQQEYEDQEEEEDDDDDEPPHPHPHSLKHINDIYRNNNAMNSNNNNFNSYGSNKSNGLSGSGFRIRIPGKANAGPGGTAKSMGSGGTAKTYQKIDEKGGGSGPHSRNAGRPNSSSYGKKGSSGVLDEMVEGIRALGEGFVRMERMKMEMAREVEEMRMEMEIKRTEMILESQQRIVEAFVKAFDERKIKKPKRMPSPEC